MQRGVNLIVQKMQDFGDIALRRGARGDTISEVPPFGAEPPPRTYRTYGDSDPPAARPPRRHSRGGPGRYRVDAGVHRPGAAHDPRPRLLLWRAGPIQELAQHHDDELRGAGH